MIIVAKKYFMFKGQKMPTKKAIITKAIKSNRAINKLQTQANVINKKIGQINYAFGKKGAWGSDKLINMLDKTSLNVIKNNKIIIPKNISKQDMKIIQNAFDRFTKYKTSSLEGIKKLEKEQIQNIQNIISSETGQDIKLSEEDAETLYRFWEDKDFNAVTDKIKPSDVWVILSDAKEKQLSKDGFLDLIGKYIDIGNDVDMKKSLVNIFSKFV